MKPRYDTYEGYALIYNKDTSMPCVIFPVTNRFRNSSNYRANWHEETEIQLVRRGEGFVLIDGEKHKVGPGDMVVIKPHCVHLTGTDGEIDYIAMILDSEFMRYADLDFSGVTFPIPINSERMEKLFSDVVAVCGETGRKCQRARTQMKLLALSTELWEQYALSEENIPRSGKSFDAVKAAISFIRENYSKKLSLDEIAAAVSTDKFNLSRKFKAATGQTLVEYLNNYRCDRAKELIREGLPISEAAVRCGFNNMSFFTRTFKNCTKRLPSEYKHK